MNNARLLILGYAAVEKKYSPPISNTHLGQLFRKYGYEVIFSHPRLAGVFIVLDQFIAIHQFKNQYEIAIIDSQGWKGFMMERYSIRLLKAQGKKVILNLNQRTLQELTQKRSSSLMQILREVDKLVVTSESMSAALANLGIHSVVIPPPLDLSQYPFRLRKRIRPRLLWLGSFDRESNPELAIRVLAKLKEMVTDSELVMAGRDGGLLKKMQALAVELNIKDSVYFHDAFNHADLVIESKKADIFIHTRLTADPSASLLEACAFGMPIIIANAGGVANHLNDRTSAILVRSNSIQEIVQAVLEIIRDPDVATRLSENGRIFAELSDEKCILEVWVHQFQDVLK